MHFKAEWIGGVGTLIGELELIDIDLLAPGSLHAQAAEALVTYDCKSEASIYISPTAKESSNNSWTPTPLIVAPRTWIGCDRRGANQLNGCLRLVYGVPYRVSERAARNMMSGATVNNPWERLALEDIIKFCILGVR